jgi:hypothetical protein
MWPIAARGQDAQKAIRYGVIASALVMAAHAADAHGIAGNRISVGTLTFDDPAVADEAVLPNFSSLDLPAEGGKAAGLSSPA